MVWELTLFKTFNNILDNGRKNVFITFVDGSKLGKAASTLKDGITIQNDLVKLETKCEISKIGFNKDKSKHKVLMENHKYKMGNGLGSHLSGKDRGFNTDHKVNTNQ